MKLTVMLGKEEHEALKANAARAHCDVSTHVRQWISKESSAADRCAGHTCSQGHHHADDDEARQCTSSEHGYWRNRCTICGQLLEACTCVKDGRR